MIVNPATQQPNEESDLELEEEEESTQEEEEEEEPQTASQQFWPVKAIVSFIKQTISTRLFFLVSLILYIDQRLPS